MTEGIEARLRTVPCKLCKRAREHHPCDDCYLFEFDYPALAARVWAWLEEKDQTLTTLRDELMRLSAADKEIARLREALENIELVIRAALAPASEPGEGT